MITVDEAEFIYAYFTGAKPPISLVDHLQVALTDGDMQYLEVDPRIRQPGVDRRPHLVVYSSCHGYQIRRYIHQHRTQVLDRYYVHIIYTHRLIMHRPLSVNPLIPAVFAMASAVMCNDLDKDYAELETAGLLRHAAATVPVATFVAPNCACFIPVLDHFGEEPVVEYIKAGVPVDTMVQMFLDGHWIARFDTRFTHQLHRLREREANNTGKISQFVRDHYQTHKMFFTENHPTYPLVAWIVEQCLPAFGIPSLGRDWCLSLPINGADMRNHIPETDYEFAYYGFKYPKQFTADFGGATRFFPDAIRRIYNKLTT
jgi:hypothetical protein